jgi:hypothetical protein
VDDEAIPLVYARNLLRGRGLVYTALEGRGEGYSDFLHVLWSALVLFITRGLQLSPLAPLLVGKAVSLAAGIAILVVTAGWLRRTGARASGLMAGLGFLALAGPLAVWSCSSLETVVFALLATGFAATLVAGARSAAILLGIGLIFERLDGIVVAGMLMVAAMAADRRSWRSVWNIAWPVCLAALAFHAWRFSFFGSLLSEPLSAKVLYRLMGTPNTMVKSSPVEYLRGLLDLYGVAAAPALLVAAACTWRVPAARMAAMGLALSGIYVGMVGDWMFGWRFCVPLFPLAALIVGLAVSRAPRTVAWCAAAGVLLWSGIAARSFLTAYVTVESRPIFWSHPRLGTAAWLAPYYELVAASRRLMHAGDRVADNQAGLLPYLLNLENIDDLGICSRFVSRLPTTDIYYTGVGRYSPLTNQPVLHTAHAYLLYQDVQFVIGRTDLLLRANHDQIPQAILDGLFELAAVDASGANAIYTRTGKPADAYRTDPTRFTENVVHISRLTRASIDGHAVAPDRFGRELPFLREGAGTRTFLGDLEIDLAFGRWDTVVYALYIGAIGSREPCTITLALFDSAGRETLKRTIAVRAGQMSVFEPFALPARARSASLKFHTADGDRLTIADLRLEGQSATLEDYIRRTLRFPAPDPAVSARPAPPADRR